MTRRRLPAIAIAASLALLLGLLAPDELLGIINPKLQPRDLFHRYLTVVVLEVTSVSEEDAIARLDARVLETLKGKDGAGEVALTCDEAMASMLRNHAVGDRIVAFAGRARPASKREQVLLYDGAWSLGRRIDPAEWRIESSADAEGDEEGGGATRLIMAGTYNGSVAGMEELVRDLAAGRAFMPATPHVAFAEDELLDRLDGPVRALALHDLDGDGSLDVYAASPAGDRVYLQLEPGVFVPATAELGLDGLASESVDVADVDGDGDWDLLAGEELFLAGEGLEGRYTRCPLLPADGKRARLIAAAFLDVHADGSPDVVTTRRGAGLGVLVHPGEELGRAHFLDESVALGLREPDCGPAGTGVLTIGDLDGDGRQDLLYAEGAGRLLLQGGDGRFRPRVHGLQLDFVGALDETVGETGGGAIADLFDRDRPALALALDGRTVLARPRTAADPETGTEPPPLLVDVTGHGNEISEASLTQSSLLVEDLDADGRLDLYTVTRRAGRAHRLHLYRGYGTYMNAPKYSASIFSGPTHQTGGARAAVAGDLDSDGACDLLVGTESGEIVILRNRTLPGRRTVEHPTSEEQAILSIGHITVLVPPGWGRAGAVVRLLDDTGHCLARRELGCAATTGSRGPDRVVLAMRPAGKGVVELRLAGGQVTRAPVEVAPRQHLTLELAPGK